MKNAITLENCRSYATEANLIKGLEKMGLASYGSKGEIPCRFVIAKTEENRWTAIFLVSEYFSRNKTGGYVGFASQNGFMSV